MRNKMNSRYVYLWLVLIYVGLPTSSGRTTFDKNVDSLLRTVRQAETDEKIVFGGEDEESSLKNYSPEEILCLAQKKILVSGECYELSKVGPCGEGEWLVLDSSIQEGENLKAICKKKPCTDANKMWWPALSKCISKTEAKSEFCKGSDKTVQTNGFGEGMCTCHDGLGKIEGDDKCYEYYQQGPCRRNEVVTYNIETGNAVCSFDKCYQENRKSISKRSISERDLHHVGRYKDTNKSLFRNMDEEEMLESGGQMSEKRFKRAAEKKRKTHAPSDSDGVCYKLGSSANCKDYGEQSRFVIDSSLHVPKCSTRNLQLQLISPANLCNIDHTNKCATSITLDSRRTAVSQAISLMKQAKGRTK